jgi:hypothetical protein
MPDYAVNTGDSTSDAWASAPAAAPAGDYDPMQNVVNANNGMPAGAPGLPVGSTGQTPTPAPAGPRADAAPAPPGEAPGLAPPTPNAPPGLLGTAFNTVKDFFTGNTTVGDYKGGGAPKLSTDASRDADQTAGQKQQAADKIANQGNTSPPPPSWWKDMF